MSFGFIRIVCPAVGRKGCLDAWPVVGWSGPVIRVLLGLRGTMFLEALAFALSREPDLEVVARVSRADEVLAAAGRERPHVAVLDLLLPGEIDVDELCRTLSGAKVLLMLDRELYYRVSVSLARLVPRVGFIATDATLDDLVASLRHLVQGKPVLDAELAMAAVRADENPLTSREREVLALAKTGATVHEVARSLHLSAGTVRNYLSNILIKTGARTRIEAIRIAEAAGWI